MKYISSEFLVIALFLILIIGSCNRYELLETKLNSEIAAIKKQFINDQNEFNKKASTKKQNFRQSLERVILWEKYQKRGDIILVPVRLNYPNKMRNRDGTTCLDKPVWLRISKDEENYTLYTLIPNKDSKSNKFTGLLLMENYFDGDITYTYVIDGRIDISLIGEKLSKKRC